MGDKTAMAVEEMKETHAPNDWTNDLRGNQELNPPGRAEQQRDSGPPKGSDPKRGPKHKYQEVRDLADVGNSSEDEVECACSAAHVSADGGYPTGTHKQEASTETSWRTHQGGTRGSAGGPMSVLKQTELRD